MLNKLKKNNEGFTIIEVMIVLAIAGLIILIVLLAIPALQRNGRNTAIKNDASALAAGVSEFASNNDGAIPKAANSDQSDTTVTLNNASGTPATAKIQSSTQYKDSDTAAEVEPAAGEITVQFGAKCPATTSGTKVTPVVNKRSTAVIYATETSNALAAKCIDG